MNAIFNSCYTLSIFCVLQGTVNIGTAKKFRKNSVYTLTLNVYKKVYTHFNKICEIHCTIYTSTR